MRKALVVGIDQYTGCPLHGCCNDADAIANVLSKNGNGSPNFDVRIEKNVSSKAELRGMIDECFAGGSDISLFYYSGHGYIDSVGGYLVTPDVLVQPLLVLVSLRKVQYFVMKAFLWKMTITMTSIQMIMITISTLSLVKSLLMTRLTAKKLNNAKGIAICDAFYLY